MRVLVLMITTALLGTFIGVGTALAHVDPYWEMVQNNYLYGGISHTAASNMNFPEFSYDVDHLGWADDDYPDATHFKLYDTGFFNGSSEDSDQILFGTAEIWDEAGVHNLLNYAFYCVRIDGINEVRDLKTLAGQTFTWDYDGLGSNNRLVNYTQNIVHTTVPDDCVFTDKAVEHWERFFAEPAP